MKHDDLHPLHELASAYLDGDVTEAERAQVEGSPELQSLVADLGAVRSSLADVPPAPVAGLVAAMTAVFAEFDLLATAGSAGAPLAPVVSLAQRRRWPARVMAAAAAVLLVGFAGNAVFNGANGQDDNSSASATAEKEMVLAAPEDQAVVAAADSAPASTIGSIFGGGDVAVVIDAPEDLLALDLPNADGTSDIGTSWGSSETIPVESAPATADMVRVGSARPAFACLTTDQVFLADILYEGQYAVAARDTVTGVTLAIADDCSVLVTVGP